MHAQGRKNRIGRYEKKKKSAPVRKAMRETEKQELKGEMAIMRSSCSSREMITKQDAV